MTTQVGKAHDALAYWSRPMSVGSSCEERMTLAGQTGMYPSIGYAAAWRSAVPHDTRKESDRLLLGTGQGFQLIPLLSVFWLG